MYLMKEFKALFISEFDGQSFLFNKFEKFKDPMPCIEFLVLFILSI